MQERNLGRSGLRVSLVGLGCNNLGGRLDAAGSQAVVHKAIDLGVTLFDTADTYGERGGSETLMGQILGDDRKDDADYLDTCRAKRNTAEYDAAGTVSQSEADELRDFAKELRSDVTAWLKAKHPALVTTR